MFKFFKYLLITFIFSTTMFFGKENIKVAKGKIGKFGLGLKKGSIILANKVKIFTKFKKIKTIKTYRDNFFINPF